MGVYIKDMEMPSCCLSCRFYIAFIGKCLVNGNIFHPVVNVAVRVLDCPLVEVPTEDVPGTNVGEWIEPTTEMLKNKICGSCEVVCSVCGDAAIDYYDFCPNCGVRMKGADDD